jgi:hypothetical protein
MAAWDESPRNRAELAAHLRNDRRDVMRVITTCPEYLHPSPTYHVEISEKVRLQCSGNISELGQKEGEVFFIGPLPQLREYPVRH